MREHIGASFKPEEVCGGRQFILGDRVEDLEDLETLCAGGVGGGVLCALSVGDIERGGKEGETWEKIAIEGEGAMWGGIEGTAREVERPKPLNSAEFIGGGSRMIWWNWVGNGALGLGEAGIEMRIIGGAGARAMFVPDGGSAEDDGGKCVGVAMAMMGEEVGFPIPEGVLEGYADDCFEIAGQMLRKDFDAFNAELFDEVTDEGTG